MAYTESEYIEICKKQIEDKFSFGSDYTQKDLEHLSNFIEGEIGVCISLSTLKRFWKNNFKQGPQLATLDALVVVLGYDNWLQFKIENKETKFPNQETPKILTPSTKNKPVKKQLVLIITLVISFILIIFLGFKNNIDRGFNKSEIVFESNKTITRGVPNTVIFNYDISKIKADSFFIQQSWNKWRKEKIDPQQNVFSSIYYESGFHRAKLIVNNEVVAEKRIHILSDGWEPHLYYKQSDKRFIDFKGESFINNGQLHISEEVLRQKNIDILKYYETRISHSQEYSVSSNNFSFTTKTKVDRNQLNTNCSWFTILLVTEKHIFSIGLRRKGCETFTHYKLGEIVRNGKTTDLSLLGLNVFDWNEIGIEVKEKQATILINGKSLYSEKFKEDFGNIVGITYIFEGTGSIDYVKLTDEHGNISFQDDFGI